MQLVGHGRLVFPAYAGMIPYFGGRVLTRGGVPRIRGDDPLQYSGRESTRWCSPHTRG